MSERTRGLLRHRVLGEESVYRQIAVLGDCVEVEVVRAPGIEPGTRIRLTLAAVSRMVDAQSAVEIRAARLRPDVPRPRTSTEPLPRR